MVIFENEIGSYQRFKNKQFSLITEHFTDLDKLNLVKFVHGEFALSLSLLLLQLQLPQKTMINSKMVKSDL